MHGHHRIYVVGGDGAAKQLTEEIGRARGYDVVFYDTVEEFLTIANSCDEGCVILLVNLPSATVESSQREIARRRPAARIVLVAHSPKVTDVVQAMRLGADDVWELPLDHGAVDARLQETFSRLEASPTQGALSPRISLLTPREHEVMERLIAGKQTKQIAGELAISPKTVEKHRSKVLHKMQARTVVDLVRMLLGQPSNN